MPAKIFIWRVPGVIECPFQLDGLCGFVLLGIPGQNPTAEPWPSPSTTQGMAGQWHPSPFAVFGFVQDDRTVLNQRPASEGSLTRPASCRGQRNDNRQMQGRASASWQP